MRWEKRWHPGAIPPVLTGIADSKLLVADSLRTPAHFHQRLVRKELLFKIPIYSVRDAVTHCDKQIHLVRRRWCRWTRVRDEELAHSWLITLPPNRILQKKKKKKVQTV